MMSSFSFSRNLGPNVHIYENPLESHKIEEEIQLIYKQQECNDFSLQRHAFLFLPFIDENGQIIPTTYNIKNIHVGFYMQILGLGMSPDDVIINGHISCIAPTGRTSVLNTFWRGIENLQITNDGTLEDGCYKGEMLWATSQACPLRRLHILGNLHLSHELWYSSGGWISDCMIEGNVISKTQQQFLSRNAKWEHWYDAVWNMKFLGCDGKYIEDDLHEHPDKCDQPRITVVPETPKKQEKPFLAINKEKELVIVKPAPQYQSTFGVSFNNSKHMEDASYVNHFYVARPDPENKATYVTQLIEMMSKSRYKGILFTPGIYEFERPLVVDVDDMVILGIGFPTLIPINGTSVLEVADNRVGITISGLMIESGPMDSNVLIKIGQSMTTLRTEKSNNISIALHDIFIRIGPTYNSHVDTAIQINSNNVLADHLWIWRADHNATYTFPSWNFCTANHGVVVNGHNVSIYGLFCEHFLKYQTIWNGENGLLYFYQSEVPYFVPNKWKSTNNTIGYASLKVNDSVKKFTALGVGIYTVFFNDDVVVTSLIEAPEGENIKIGKLVGVLIKPGGSGNVPCSTNGVGGAEFLINKKFPMGKTPNKGVREFWARGLNYN